MTVRLYTGFPLLDVRDVEAHVRTLLDARLRDWGAHLDPAKYDAAVAYLVTKCWELSGVEADGRTPRRPYYAAFRVVPATDPELPGKSGDLGPYRSLEVCQDVAVPLTVAAIKNAGHIALVRIGRRRPRGAYNPDLGLSFSTYSRRILTNRVVDWYRSTFGDDRYQQHEQPLSLDEYWNQVDAEEAYLDRAGPGAIASFVDQLNIGAYLDQTEEVLTRAAIAL